MIYHSLRFADRETDMEARNQTFVLKVKEGLALELHHS